MATWDRRPTPAASSRDDPDRVKRLTLVTCVLGSSIVWLDATAINVALPAIARDLGGGLPTQQWVINAYALMLGALILFGGSLGDVFGARRIFVLGLVGFGATSLACAIAPTAGSLIAARAFQGVAGALLTPVALTLIMTTFEPDERGRAIAQWTAWGGVASVAGPVVAGQLVEAASWRWVFLMNLPVVVAALVLVVRTLPVGDHAEHRQVDVPGAVFAAFGLGGPVFALTEQPRMGWTAPGVILPLALGVGFLVMFVVRERRIRDPMLPMGLFAGRNFTVGNVQTLMMYAGMAMLFFLLGLFLQEVGGWTAMQAGVATLPATLVLFALSGRFGMLADRLGPRMFLGVGPLVAAVGLLLLLRVERDVDVPGALVPALLVFAVGLSMAVAPQTATVLAGVEEEQAGIASAVNNAVARVAGLAAVAGLGPLIGAQLDVAMFHKAITAAAVVVGAAGLLGALFIRNPERVVLAQYCAGGQLTGAPREVARSAAISPVSSLNASM